MGVEGLGLWRRTGGLLMRWGQRSGRGVGAGSNSTCRLKLIESRGACVGRAVEGIAFWGREPEAAYWAGAAYRDESRCRHQQYLTDLAPFDRTGGKLQGQGAQRNSGVAHHC